MSRENWWLDFVESEVDPATRAQMKALLRSSAADQELVKSLSDTKTAIKEAENAPMITEEQLGELHDYIMAAIEQTEIKPAPVVVRPILRLSPEHRRTIRNATVLGALLFSVAAGVRMLTHKGLNTQWDISQQMAQHGHENPEELSQLMTYQSETDFFVDVASQSLDHLTKEQFESLFQSTKTR